MRIRVMKNFQLAGFFDIGSLTDSFGAINWNTVRRSVGLGIRYVTPVGPIRVDYGFKLIARPANHAEGCISRSVMCFEL